MSLRRCASVVGCIAVVALLGGCVEAPSSPVEPAPFSPVDDVEAPVPAAASIDRRAQEVTVRIRSLGCEQLGLGSGFVLPGGVVVTNRHVVVQPLEVTVNTWDGRTLPASVTGVAVDSDLALLQLDDATDLPVAELRTTPVRAGERVYAVGYPGGGPATISEGQVVSLVNGELLGEPADVIRIDAEIRRGNSGGPLLDEDGLVVGVVFALEEETGTGLAVPVTTLVARLAGAELEAPSGC